MRSDVGEWGLGRERERVQSWREVRLEDIVYFKDKKGEDEGKGAGERGGGGDAELHGSKGR